MLQVLENRYNFELRSLLMNIEAVADLDVVVWRGAENFQGAPK